MRRLFNRWRRAATAESRLDEEIQFHLEQQTAKNLGAGMTPEEAHRHARRQFGGATQTFERAREAIGLRWLGGVRRDVAYAVRRLVRDRWVTLGALVAIALGIGANTAVFAIVNTVLFGGLPLDQPDKIVWLDTRDLRGRPLLVSLEDFEDWRCDSSTTV